MMYPHCDTLIPQHLGHKIKSEATLHTIMNEIRLQSSRNPHSVQSLSLTKISTFEKKLHVWKNELPAVLAPEELIFPPHLSLQ